jgi:integrase
MAKSVNRLTELRVRRAAKGWHHDGGGLYLRVDNASGRWWVYRYGPGGKRYHGLGPVAMVSLAEAREQARKCKLLLFAGTDPIAAGKAARAALGNSRTFRDCAHAYHEAHRASWRSAKSAHDWMASIEAHAFPTLDNLPVAAIDTPAVLRVLEPIWRTHYETASRLRGRIESVLDWAKVHGYRDGENPARWRGHLDHLLPVLGKAARVKHHTALPYAEIADFVAKLRRLGAVEARALEFLILTAARAGEVCGAEWAEVDRVAKIWTVPAARMKAGREHRVPLSGATLDTLNRLPGDRARPFPVAPGALRRVVKEIAGDRASVHGFRSSFRDWVGEQTAFPRELAEMALAHRAGSDVERAYARGDLVEKRRELMEAWARFCLGVAHVAQIRVGGRG